MRQMRQPVTTVAEQLYGEKGIYAAINIKKLDMSKISRKPSSMRDGYTAV